MNDPLNASMPRNGVSFYKQVVINGRRMEIIKEAVSAVNVANCNNHECARLSNTCDFHGTCVPDKESWRCSCDVGFGGPRCQKGLVVALTPLNSVQTGFSLSGLYHASFNGHGFLSFDKPSLLRK